MATPVNVAVQQVAPQVYVSNRNNPRGLNVKAILGLGITQIVFGVLALVFGIATVAGFSNFYWVNRSGSGIWFGLWIILTGTIGVLSAKRPTERSLNGCNMGFNIVNTVVSFFVGIFFIVALVEYSNCRTYYHGYWYGQLSIRSWCNDNKGAGAAIYGILTFLMVAEFFVSMSISILCCQNGCCSSHTQGGVIIQQQPVAAGTVINTSTSGVVMSGGYPVASYPQGYQPQQGYPPQSSVGGYPPQAYPAGQPYMTSAPMGGTQMMQPAYSTGYQQDPTKNAPPPPAYTE